MAGFVRAYFIGGQGGFMGADGVNPLTLEILEGHSDRIWFQPVYVEPGVRGLGRVRVTVPKGADDPNMLLDACIAFYPEAFESCPSMSLVRSEIGSPERLDFDAHEGDVPASWAQLREEARNVFADMSIWKADLVPYAVG